MSVLPLLTSSWLRERMAAPAAKTPIREPAARTESTVAAAVLVPIVLRPSGVTLLLTQRTAHLRDHAGQVSFPGGRCEPTDASLVATALRESKEEVGLEPGQIDVLGALPNYYTSTGFCVTPIVGLVTPPLNLRLDDFEVAEVFEVPLTFLLDVANYRRETMEYAGRLRSYWAVPWKGYFIWGATAGMLVSLRQHLLAEEDEQPPGASVISS